MSAILRYKSEIIFTVLIILLYFFLRLPNLTTQPIFADEAIYIRWAQVMKAEPTLRFISVQDGKTPFFMWGMMPFLGVFQDPLFAGRILSVFSGLATMVGVYFLARLLFNSKVALFAAVFYAVSPYMIFFDRMALVDSMLATFTIWAMFFAFLLTRFLRFDLAMILGYLLGVGLLVKTPAMMNILALPSILIAFSLKKAARSRLTKLLCLLIVAVFIAMVIYNLLRLGPNFSQLSSRNEDYIFSITEILMHPLDPLIPHFKDALEVFTKMLTVSIFFLIILGIFFTIKMRNRFGAAILVWALIPIVLQLTFLKIFTARYILFSIPPLLIIGAYGFNNLLEVLKNSKQVKASFPYLTVVLLLLFIVPSLIFDYLILNNIAKAPLPANEREGYLEEWTAGYGFKETAQFLAEKRKEKTVVVGTEGYFGTLPEGLRIYLDKSAISFVGSTATVSAEIRGASNDHLTYFVANKNRLRQAPENSVLIKEFPKALPLDGGPQDAIVVYQIFPD